MNLRKKLVEADIEPVRQLLKDTGVFTPEEVDCGVELAEETLAGADGYHWVLAEEDGRLLGVICYGSVPLTEGTWDLYWILRSPSANQKGVAAALLKVCEQDLRENQARLLGAEHIRDAALSARPGLLSPQRVHLGRAAAGILSSRRRPSNLHQED